MRKLDLPRLLIISNGQQTQQPIADVLIDLCHANTPWVLLREDGLSLDEQRALAAQIMPYAAKTKISISDDWEFALEIGAAGVHVAPDADLDHIREQTKNLIMGVHCHNNDEVRRAAAAKADYITLSPIFETISKPGYGPALGLEMLEQTAQQSDIPIFALGGITLTNAAACINAGASGIAVMGGIMRADDPAGMMRQYLALTAM